MTVKNCVPYPIRNSQFRPTEAQAYESRVGWRNVAHDGCSDSLVALPQKPGRNALVLPPVPVAIARASGELVTVCTAPHSLIVDNPIAAREATPTESRASCSREKWTALRNASTALGIGAPAAHRCSRGLCCGACDARPAPPPPPRRVHHGKSLEELAQVEAARFFEQACQDLVDHLSDTLRKYLEAATALMASNGQRTK